jgi:very-short-patch-repair endonuclease
MLYENNSKLKTYARNLRRDQTDAEKQLWFRLRKKQLGGYKFYRQFAVDNYILDFYCHEKKVVVELDGSQHMEQIMYDMKRTNELQRYGMKVIRFWDNEVLTNVNGVLEVILENLNKG